MHELAIFAENIIIAGLTIQSFKQTFELFFTYFYGVVNSIPVFSLQLT